jgi:hypothetical protein
VARKKTKPDYEFVIAKVNSTNVQVGLGFNPNVTNLEHSPQSEDPSNPVLVGSWHIYLHAELIEPKRFAKKLVVFVLTQTREKFPLTASDIHVMDENGGRKYRERRSVRLPDYNLPKNIGGQFSVHSGGDENKSRTYLQVPREILDGVVQLIALKVPLFVQFLTGPIERGWGDIRKLEVRTDDPSSDAAES